MKIKIQRCWHGGEKFSYRALICGGLLVYTNDEWNRTIASQMLDLIALHIPGKDRKNIRFIHA